MINVEAELWIWRAENGVGWHFITLPFTARDAIRDEIVGLPRKGFGSIKVEVCLGVSTFQTSLFPAKEYDSYLLPIKATVRKANQLEAGTTVRLEIAVL